MFLNIVLIISCFVYACSPAQTDDRARESQAESITIEELRDHMFFLASDFLEGRCLGSAGYDIAVEYAVSQFRHAGLKPIFKDSDGKETFFQYVPFMRQTTKTESRLILRTTEGEKEFSKESFKIVERVNADISDEFLPIVFVGYAIEEPGYGWNDFEGLDLEGKIAVMQLGAPTRDDKPVLPREIHNKYLSFAGGQLKARNILLNKRPVALLVIADAELKQAWDAIPGQSDIPSYRYAGGNGQDNDLGYRVVLIKDNPGNAIFEDQVYSPYKMKGGLEGYKAFELENASLGLDIAVEESVSSRSIVAIVPGTDPELSRQYVTLGAHLDHIYPRDGRIFNGADDNASGSAGVIEIAEAVAMNPPRRTVIFCLFAAEEWGLKGSQHFVNECPVPLEDIIANINLDMIGRYDRKSMAARSHYVRGAEGIGAELREVILAVNERTVKWPLVFQRPENYTASSDQVPFQRKGIPAARFFSGDHEDLHRPTDDPEKIEFEKMQKISRLVYEIIMELANRDEPLEAGI